MSYYDCYYMRIVLLLYVHFIVNIVIMQVTKC